MKQSIIILAALVLLAASAYCAGDETTDRSDWPESKGMVEGRLAIQDHGMQQGAHVLSVIVELKNRSGHALEMVFDPHDLRIEVFNSEGGRVEEDAAVNRSGPVPMSHRMTISAGAYAGLPTHRGGVGLPVRQTMLAAGWQVWTLPPGKYTAKGTATITAGFGSAVLDSGLPYRGFKAKENDFPPVGKTKAITVELQAVRFQVDAINADDEATIVTTAPENSGADSPEQKVVPPPMLIGDLQPKLDGKEVTVKFTITKLEMVAQLSKEGQASSFVMKTDGGEQKNVLTVWIEGELANVMDRLQMSHLQENQLKPGTTIIATGQLGVHTTLPHVYLLSITKWQDFRVLPAKTGR